MSNIDEIKDRIKKIRKNFNPEKATYKILSDLLTEDYTAGEMADYMLRIKGIDKYPEYLKEEFIDIVKSLKLLEKEEIIEEKEEDVSEESEELEEPIKEEIKKEKTQELKSIIDALENTEKVKQKVVEETEEISLEKTQELEEPDEEVDDNTIPSKIFKVVLVILVIAILLTVGLILFY